MAKYHVTQNIGFALSKSTTFSLPVDGHTEKQRTPLCRQTPLCGHLARDAVFAFHPRFVFLPAHAKVRYNTLRLCGCRQVVRPKLPKLAPYPVPFFLKSLSDLVSFSYRVSF